MPKYEFECAAHGPMEVEHAIETPHPRFCPVEGCREELTRVFTKMNTVLYEGSGWTGALMTGFRRDKTEMVSPESNTPYD